MRKVKPVFLELISSDEESLEGEHETDSLPEEEPDFSEVAHLANPDCDDETDFVGNLGLMVFADNKQSDLKDLTPDHVSPKGKVPGRPPLPLASTGT